MIACENFVEDATRGKRNRFCANCGRTRLLHDLAKKELPPPRVPDLHLIKKEDDDAV